ncbi:hypothetical protein CYMTET_20217 [Cymbomonas tetramitiformis]|uniref:Uncharacterized protein n=1 Tax=Cymbomonas tetramitiformis TaxID=36881 RepID=A0AAE0G5U8_9CHLO|nr:hypothetical protein CYMTET_20217 [Cymbomonas tetramitiformis]
MSAFFLQSCAFNKAISTHRRIELRAHDTKHAFCKTTGGRAVPGTRQRKVLCERVQVVSLSNSTAVDYGRRAILRAPLGLLCFPGWTLAAEESSSLKLRNLTPDEIKDIVTSDVVDRQFLATANFSPEIYSPSCTFTDEIDTYEYADFVKGTQALFDASQSSVKLVGEVQATDTLVSFRFDEELAFNVPLKPKLYLSGQVLLKRDEEGLISSYKEEWDQSVLQALQTVHF